MRPASGVAISMPVPSVLALKPIAQERNGLSSGAIVGARWVGIGRTYAPSAGAAAGEATVDGAASGTRARLPGWARLTGADFMKLSGCGFWTVEEFAGDELVGATGAAGVAQAGGGTYGT